MIDNNLADLKEPFRTKCKVFLEVARKTYPEITPFETLRTYARQLLLFTQRKSWTLQSYHLKGLACDRVFMRHGQPSRQGDYNFLQRVAGMCGMERIKQETCHTQDNGTPISIVMAQNSSRYNNSQSEKEKELLHEVNDTFRKYLTPTI